jgi:hypothetical protein
MTRMKTLSDKNADSPARDGTGERVHRYRLVGSTNDKNWTLSPSLAQPTMSIPVLGQTLHAHITRCTKQDDTTSVILRLDLARAKQTWLCLSWTELIQEAEARDWDDTLDEICLRLAACDQYTDMQTSFHNIEDQRPQAMCAVVVSKTFCKDRNHRILRGVIAPHQDFFFLQKL